ncbi:MAG: hypothetical protein JJ894_03125 [Dinoroseobacter sp.]|nr:hypothetical protein [Dinoroseobacter sp.]
MPRDQHTDILEGDEYEELTDGPVGGAFSFQILSGRIELVGTTDATQPPRTKKGFVVDDLYGDFSTTLDKLFPSGGKTRLWGRAVEFQSEYWIDHA